MSQLIRSTNLATKFQILAEIAARQPDIQQRDIARRLELSPQAVSDYVKELLQDGWLSSEGRSKYRVTREGVDWMSKGLREWLSYANTVRKALSNISVCAAVAGQDLSGGQKVGIVMKDGFLCAVDDPTSAARGVAVSDAKAGEDVGISNIDGIVPLEIGKVTILRIPAVQRGGSRKANIDLLKKSATDKPLIGAIGIEALAALRKAGIEPSCVYGVRDAVVEAAHSGLSPAVACVDDDISDLLRRLEQNDIEYDILDLRKA